MIKTKKTTKGSQAVKIQKELLTKGLRLAKGYEIVKRAKKK
jgi:hypothetical protein